MPRNIVIHLSVIFWLILATLSIPVILERAKPVSAYWIAYSESVDGNRDIYVRSLFDGSPIRITYDPADDYLPQWSPDGKWIAFLREDEESYSVHVAKRDGSLERKVWSREKDFQGYPEFAWPPNSDFLEIEYDLVRISDGHVLYERFPVAEWNSFSRSAWSPDGKWRLAVHSVYYPESRLYLQHPKTESNRLLSNLPVSTLWISWSVDGEWAYFLSPTDTSHEHKIFRIHLATSQLEEITATRMPNFGFEEPYWSFDGEWLYFTDPDSETSTGVRRPFSYRLNPSKNEVEELGTIYDWYYLGRSDNGQTELHIDFAGNGLYHYVVNRAIGRRFHFGDNTSYLWDSSLSPDGLWLAYLYAVGYETISILNAENGEEHILRFRLPEDARDISMDWTPESLSIVFRDGDYLIQTRIYGGNRRQLFRLHTDNFDFNRYDFSPNQVAHIVKRDHSLLGFIEAYPLWFMALIIGPLWFIIRRIQ